MRKIITAAAIALGLSQAFTPMAQAQDVVKFGSTRVPAPVNVAMAKGFFEEEGLVVEQQFFKSGAEVAPAVASRMVDVAITTSGAALFNAFVKGMDVKLVADGLTLKPEDPENDPTAIMVRKELIDTGAVKSGADLAGQRVAITAPGQIIDMIAREYLRQNGVNAEDVTFVSMPPPDMVAAMKGGSIDAAIMLDPFSSIAAQQGFADKLAAGSEFMPGLQQAFVLFGPSITEGNRELGERFLRAYAKGSDWMREALKTPEGRAEVAAIYQAVIPAQDPKMYETIAMPTPVEDLRVNVDGDFGIQWQVDQLAAQGLLLGDPDISSAVDNSFLDAIAE